MINKDSRNKNYNNINNDYIAGYMQAKLLFIAPFIKGKNNQLYIKPKLNISDNINNKDLILLIKNKLNNIGYIINQSNKNIINYNINNIDHLINNIIPLLNKSQLRSDKYLTYLNFKLLINILYYEKPIYGSSLWTYCAILAINLNPLIKKSTQLRYLNNQDKYNIINGIIPKDINIKELQYKYCIELYNNNFISEINNNTLITNCQLLNSDFINGLIDGNGNLYININNNTLNCILSIKQDINNISLLNDIKSYFNNIGNIHKSNYNNNDIYYHISNIDIINIVIPKLTNYNNNNNNINYNELTGPKIILYKIYNYILIYNILKENTLTNEVIFNKVLIILYNTISNKKNITYKEYKLKMINKLNI